MKIRFHIYMIVWCHQDFTINVFSTRKHDGTTECDQDVVPMNSSNLEKAIDVPIKPFPNQENIENIIMRLTVPVINTPKLVNHIYQYKSFQRRHYKQKENLFDFKSWRWFCFWLQCNSLSMK